MLYSIVELKLSLVKLKTERRVYDHMINILENSKGAYLSIEKKLKLLIPKIKKNFTEQESHILHIKYSADGAQIIRQKSILNLTFTNEGKLAETSEGNYTIGIFDITNEDYDTISICFAEIKIEIDNLSEIEIDGLKYNIET